MQGGLRVLSVGSRALASLVKDALVLNPQSHVSVAEGYWDLFFISLSESEHVSLAILEPSTPEQELRQRAEQIRRRWPDAKILVVGEHVGDLEDWLYDERVPSGVRPEKLLALMERLEAAKSPVSRSMNRHRGVSRTHRHVYDHAWK